MGADGSGGRWRDVEMRDVVVEKSGGRGKTGRGTWAGVRGDVL